ncbi:lysophospholipid acyltransferase family protein [Myxococcaceae bacterium GXIMD 01537]
MAKRVLGNDPFQRGAAQRPTEAAAEPPKKPAKKAAAKKSAGRAAKAPKAPRAPRAAPETPRIQDATLPVREPAGPEVSHPAPPSPLPMAAVEERPVRTKREEAVDEVLATLAEAEAEEAAAEAEAEAVLAQSSAPGDTRGERVASALEEQEDREEEPEPGRPPPLMLVPSLPPDADAAHSGERGPVPEELPAFGARAAGVLGLAREIAGQALASEALGQAAGAASGLWGALRAGLGTRGSTSLDEYGKDASLVGELAPVLDFLYERYWRVSVQGASHLPRGAAILVANHSGALPYDGLVMYLALARERPDLSEARWLVEDQIFHAPVLGTLFNRLGAVRACPDNALRLLDEQRPVVVFPEGYQGMSKPFAQRYQLKRFGRGGFVKLALRTGAPIVPVAIVGAEETSPLLGRIPAPFLGVPYLPVTPPGPLPAKWSIRFGEPIGMEGLSPESADDLGEVTRLTERTRESIQGMIQALLRERRGVFAG